MDPTVAIPLHFSLENIVVSAAGLVLAWSALRRKWPAAAASFVYLVVAALHAGQFIERDDEPMLIVLRIVSLVGMTIFIFPDDPDRFLFSLGISLLATGQAWAALVGGSAADLVLGAHIVAACGGVVVCVWAWRAARPSLRLRVLAAFVSVLAVAVVVAGGAVARVAAVNSREEQYSRLRDQAATIRQALIDTRAAMRRRAAVLSPFLATEAATGHPSFEGSLLLPGEWGALISGGEVLLAATRDASVPYTSSEVQRLPLLGSASDGKVSSLSDVTSEGISMVGAAPIFRPGGAQNASDVVGVIVVGRLRPPNVFLASLASRNSQIEVADDDAVARTDPSVPVVPAAKIVPGAIRVLSVGGGAQGWLAAVAPLPDSSSARLVLASSATNVVNAVTELVRAFLIAILAATLLAIVAGLWLSTRLARPMLDLADEAERVKTDFLASVSHELRTPLTPIRGYAEILRSRRVPTRDQNEYLDEIGQAAQRLERIVALLLDVAAIEAGRFRIDPYDIEPSELLNDTQQRWTGRSRRHEINVEIGKDVPAVMADAEAIARVLDELVDNAIKFSPDGPVELGAARAGDNIVFSVSDNGPGMDFEKVEAMREAFKQAESGDTRRFGGLGLGLAFCEGVLAGHGSRLDIESKEGKGTTCSFALPVAGSVTRMPAAAAMRKR